MGPASRRIRAAARGLQRRAAASTTASPAPERQRVRERRKADLRERLHLANLVRVSFSPASVVETALLNSRLRRIVLEVDNPAVLDVKPAGDSAVGVYFDVDDHPGGAGRNYSVRHQDGRLLTLDVVLHSRGPGTEWASEAAAGDRVVLDHARSWYRPPPRTDWQLLVSDLSGLPATARIVEQLPRDAVALVVVEVAASEDLEYLPGHPNVTVLPSIGTGNGAAASTLMSTVGDLELPAGHGYCWFAGEAAESRAVRKYLRSEGWTIEQYDITGYWRLDSEAWDARFAEVVDDVLPVYEQALTAGKGDKAAFEEFDEACERIGL
ncbi:siderophore-interacting protein [Mycolicibacterium gilvum]|uniref:Siderophore-interacting protein n=1 Tax=Mycolicibacterium gilvum TaxID=1804 RepID=A0A378SMU1_9MYCO|nr:siderophore-interacting protein [Mycolicibacterium gilvum]